MPRNLENARPDRREDRLDGPDDAVIERVHCAGRFRFADAARDQWLDIQRLDLDIHNRPGADDIERLAERRNARTVSKRELLELRCRQLGDRLVRRPLWVPGVNHGIVVNDDDPVTGRVDVQLYSIGSELDGALESRKRVLGMGLVRPSVSDALRQVQASTCSQAFLQVVAL